MRGVNGAERMEDDTEVLAWIEMWHRMQKQAFRAKTMRSVLDMLILQYLWRYIVDHQTFITGT